MPRVSINIVTWNSALYIVGCLDAVFAQTFKDFAVTIVDNASSDKTLSLIESYSHGEISLLRNEQNTGYAKAHNRAINETDSDYVLTLNPDVLLAPEYVEVVVGVLDGDQCVGSVAGKLIQISDEEFSGDLALAGRAANRQLDSTGLVMKRNRRQTLRGHMEPSESTYGERNYIFGPDGAAGFYRRSMLADIRLGNEYFDELFDTHKEDVDLVWRSQLLGWTSIYDPGAVAYHVRGFRPSKRKVMSTEIRRKAVRNRWLMNLKNDTPGLVLRDIGPIVVYELKILGYLILFEQSSLLAIWDTLRVLPEVLRRRRSIQRRARRDPDYMAQWFI